MIHIRREIILFTMVMCRALVSTVLVLSILLVLLPSLVLPLYGNWWMQEPYLTYRADSKPVDCESKVMIPR